MKNAHPSPQTTSGPAQPKLFHYLLRWTMGTVVLVWLTLLVVAWSAGLRESRQFADGQLIAMARLWIQSTPSPTLVVDPKALAAVQHEYRQEMAVIDWLDGHVVSDSHGLASGLALDDMPVNGLVTLSHRSEQGTNEWRAFSLSAEQGGHQRRVAVLIDSEKRRELGNDMAEHVAAPSLLIFPLVALLLVWAIRRGLRPLDHLSQEVAAFDGLAGQRLDPEHRFREFGSTVTAINTLVDTLQRQAQRERAFASDVAHELRTPLTAMALQASAAQADPTPERLAQLERASLRAGRILSQLLDLARAQRAGAAQLATEAVDVGELAAQLVAGHAQKAYTTQHELSLSRPDGLVSLAVPPLLLELALRNLIDNALQHTPANTHVNVALERTVSEVRLSVSDDGPRQVAAELAADQGGLGLGLRLVQRIAEEMGASLVRDQGEPPMATRFTLRWEMAPQPDLRHR